MRIYLALLSAYSSSSFSGSQENSTVYTPCRFFFFHAARKDCDGFPLWWKCILWNLIMTVQVFFYSSWHLQYTSYMQVIGNVCWLSRWWLNRSMKGEKYYYSVLVSCLILKDIYQLTCSCFSQIVKHHTESSDERYMKELFLHVRRSQLS